MLLSEVITAKNFVRNVNRKIARLENSGLAKIIDKVTPEGLTTASGRISLKDFSGRQIRAAQQINYLNEVYRKMGGDMDAQLTISQRKKLLWSAYNGAEGKGVFADSETVKDLVENTDIKMTLGDALQASEIITDIGNGRSDMNTLIEFSGGLLE